MSHKKQELAPGRRHSPFQILIVDDMASARSLLRKYLKDEGFRVDEAENGVKALWRIADNPPDLVVMDVLMPGMDGIECCRRIKGNRATKTIPVIMLTSIGNTKQRTEAAAAGCDSYLTKPVRKERLLDKIRSWLKPEVGT